MSKRGKVTRWSSTTTYDDLVRARVLALESSRRRLRAALGKVLSQQGVCTRAHGDDPCPSQIVTKALRSDTAALRGRGRGA